MKKIVEALFGKRYYAVIATDRVSEMLLSRIYSTRAEAEEKGMQLNYNESIDFVSVVSFRTKDYLENEGRSVGN